jgi:hypothetical protein
VKVKILKPITRPQFDAPFHLGCRITYDSRNPCRRKQHTLIDQRDPQRFGTVGDRCDYLDHGELLELEAAGYIKIDRRRNTST